MAYFRLNHELQYHHQIPVDQFDDHMPWEKDAYVGMLVDKVREENERTILKNQEAKVAARRG